MADEVKKGGMTVAEAGRKGGVKVAQERGRAFYEQIGHKGGQKVRELIEQGKKMAKQTADREAAESKARLDEMGNLKTDGNPIE